MRVAYSSLVTNSPDGSLIVSKANPVVIWVYVRAYRQASQLSKSISSLINKSLRILKGSNISKLLCHDFPAEESLYVLESTFSLMVASFKIFTQRINLCYYMKLLKNFPLSYSIL